MGLLIKGVWHNEWYDTQSSDGEFIRNDAQFRSEISSTIEGSRYQPEANRYHLFVSLACPWAHRVLIMRKLKKLEKVIGVTVVKPEMLKDGWEIDIESPIPDLRYLHQVYTLANPEYTGRVTVPVLWDNKHQTIVNNESSEIIRMLNTEFDEFSEVTTNYYPAKLHQEIDQINDYIYSNINNGVYKVGFATTQVAYENAFDKLFMALDKIEQILDLRPYLTGDNITEADWRLFTTLIRFDAVYYNHFKTNLKRLEDYANLSNYVRDLYQLPGVAETVNFAHIKKHYFFSHDMINPTQIIPKGPEINYCSAHNRNRFNLAAHLAA